VEETTITSALHACCCRCSSGHHRAACGTEQAHERVAENGVAEMADWRALLGLMLECSTAPCPRDFYWRFFVCATEAATVARFIGC